jgi:hypothetical protein
MACPFRHFSIGQQTGKHLCPFNTGALRINLNGQSPVFRFYLIGRQTGNRAAKVHHQALLPEPEVLIFDDPDGITLASLVPSLRIRFPACPALSVKSRLRSPATFLRVRLPVPASLGSDVGSRAVLGMQISLWQSGFRRHAHRFCYSVRLSPQPLDACEPGEMRDGRRYLGSGPQKTGAACRGGGELSDRRQLDVLHRYSAAPSRNPDFRLSRVGEALGSCGLLLAGPCRMRGDRIMSNDEAKRSFRGEQVAVRLEPELRRTIEELARKERRSLSGYLHNIICDAVAAQSGSGAAA